jgi:hypothetical protein
MNLVNSLLHLLKFTLPALAALLVCVLPAHSASLAFDSAADSVYDNGWQNGDNGGTGWGGGWEFSGIGPFFVSTSTTNGVGDPANDGDIDTQGRAWGTWTFTPVNSTHENNATRPFSGALSIGQSFVVDFDNGIEYGGSSLIARVGFTLGNNLGSAFIFNAQVNANYATGYGIGDANGGSGLPIGFTDQGLHIMFTLTSPTSYSLSVSAIGTDGPPGVPYIFNGSLDATMGTNITAFTFYDINSGTDPANWNFFNSMAIVPEPSTFALAMFGVLLLGVFRKRRAQCARPTA